MDVKVKKKFIRNASLQKHLQCQPAGSKKVNKINNLFDSEVMIPKGRII